MDIYTLDDQLRRLEVFDTYKSLIWVERNRGPGEFELFTMNTKAARDIFQRGRRLTRRGSKCVMVVETHTYIANSDERLLKIYGRGVEKVFEDRVVAPSLGPQRTRRARKLCGRSQPQGPRPFVTLSETLRHSNLTTRSPTYSCTS